MFSPVTFGYTSLPMTWSDVVSGALLVAFAGLALFPRWDFVGRWTVALVGVWLQFAPLIVWVPRGGGLRQQHLDRGGGDCALDSRSDDARNGASHGDDEAGAGDSARLELHDGGMMWLWTITPKQWREWSRAGVVQAFIIEFYAEM